MTFTIARSNVSQPLKHATQNTSLDIRAYVNNIHKMLYYIHSHLV